MRVWVQSPGSSNIRVCEFKLEFLSYIKNKIKKDKNPLFYIKKKKKKKRQTPYNIVLDENADLNIRSHETISHGSFVLNYKILNS